MRRRGLLSLILAMLVPFAAWAQGNPVGPEFRVNTYTTADQIYPSVAVDGAGNFVVVWTGGSQDGSSYGVFGQRYASSGAPLSPEFRVNTYTTGGQILEVVAATPSGSFVVTWTSFQDGSGDGVFGQRYASSGAPLGLEFRVNTYTTGAQSNSTVAADSAGNFVVVWQSTQDPGLGIFGQRYASSGVPIGPEFRVNTYTTGAQYRPAVASDPSGNVIVVWGSVQDGSADGIFGQRYASSGAPLGPEFRVNTFTTGSQHIPSVAVDALGGFVVVWTSQLQDGSSDGVFGQRYANSGAPLGPEFRINTYTTSGQADPAIAADSSGNFVVSWDSLGQDGLGDGIFGQRYASSGAPLGPEFRVNSYTILAQFGSAAAADALGNFVVVWGGFQPAGAIHDILGQRYSQIVPVELMHFRVE